MVKWPPGDRAVTHIKIQQDEHKHILRTTIWSFLEMLADRGLNAQMITQPVNSPDTNLLDLVFLGGSICK